MRNSKSRQQGNVIIMVALSLSLLIGVVGLALDTGISYMVRDKLNAATDSASLAAARAVSQGNDQATQIANAQAAAARFFNANFPSGYMGATVTMAPTTVVFDSGKAIINVSASAKLPVSLMGVINSSPLTPGITSQVIRKDLDMVFVMDTSGSLLGSATNVRSSAVSFLNKFNNVQDRIGLLRFSYGAVIDNPIKTSGRGFDRATMISQINNYQFSGSTASVEGMWQARAQLATIPVLNRSNLRVVVFFSDGAPNSFPSYFPFKVPTDCLVAGTLTTDDDTTSDYPGGLYFPNAISSKMTGKCGPTNNSKDLTSYVTNNMVKLPDWYNAHNLVTNPNDPNLQEFPIVTSSPRVVTNDLSTKDAAWRNVNRASRNLAEAIAADLRNNQGVYVFTLGLGTQIDTGTGPDSEKGSDVLKCMANSTDAPTRCFNAAKPVGLYCHAASDSELTPCFSKLASAIMRISK